MKYRKPLKYNNRIAMIKDLKELAVFLGQFIGVLAAGMVAFLLWYLLSIFILV